MLGQSEFLHPENSPLWSKPDILNIGVEECGKERGPGQVVQDREVKKEEESGEKNSNHHIPEGVFHHMIELFHVP